MDETGGALDRLPDASVEGWLGPGFPIRELHRLRGEIQAVEKNDPAAAEQSFREALDSARSQSARSDELRAASSYGRMVRDQGRGEEAHAVLAPVYERFTEGFEFTELVDAKALLDELAWTHTHRVEAPSAKCGKRSIQTG
jgi:predicted ATPase